MAPWKGLKYMQVALGLTLKTAAVPETDPRWRRAELSEHRGGECPQGGGRVHRALNKPELLSHQAQILHLPHSGMCQRNSSSTTGLPRGVCSNQGRPDLGPLRKGAQEACRQLPARGW